MILFSDFFLVQQSIIGDDEEILTEVELLLKRNSKLKIIIRLQNECLEPALAHIVLVYDSDFLRKNSVLNLRITLSLPIIFNQTLNTKQQYDQ